MSPIEGGGVMSFSSSFHSHYTDKEPKYALHIINLASVRDVGKKIAGEIPMFSALRFRPNVISKLFSHYS
jgi:hypothetical protein